MQLDSGGFYAASYVRRIFQKPRVQCHINLCMDAPIPRKHDLIPTCAWARGAKAPGNQRPYFFPAGSYSTA